MVREMVAFHLSKCDDSRQQCNSTVNQPFGTFEPPCNPNPNAMAVNMSQHNSNQLPSKQIFPEGQFLPAKVVQSSPQATRNYLPKLDLDFTAQFTTMSLQIQEMIFKRAQLQHQIRERQRHQELLMQRKAELLIETIIR